MGLEHLYGRIVTVALGALLGVCALLATAKFVRSRARLLSPLVRAHGAVFAVMMGAVAVTAIIASVKPENAPTNMVGRAAPSAPQEPVNGAPLRRPGGWPPYRPVGSRVPRDRRITNDDIADGYRVAETREGCEIVGRDAFDAPQIHALWLARGGYRDATRIAPSGWSFPWRDGIMDGITVLSRGEIRPDVRTLYFPRPFDAPLAVVPSFNWRLLPGGVSNVFWHAVSPSNSLVVTWENSPVNRDVNSLTNFQAELFADGSFVYRYDDHTIAYSRVHPLDLDFDGLPNAIDIVPETPLDTSAWNQSDAWAAAAFPSNAAEIASAGGYAAWAARRASDPNRRLIGLGVASPGGRWPICVEVGGVPVMADGRAELLYAIDCGAQVPFSLSDGELGAVAVSCAQPDFQTFTLSNLQTFSFPYECMIGDVTLHLDTPRTGWLRRIAEVSVDAPNLTHLHPGDTAQLAAVVANCHADAYLGCTWHGGAGISFSNAHSLTTTVAYASSSQVQWATNNAFLVTSYAGGYCVTNASWFTVGMENEPTPSFSIGCQDVFFLNDADVLDGGATNRPERICPVTFNLQAPQGTSGTILVSADGTAKPVVCYVENGVTNRVNPMTLLPISVTNSFACTGQYMVYVSCPQRGSGTLTATLTLDGGGTLTDTVSFKCIEPLRKLVTTEKDAGRFINPSRLVMGTNAVLRVGVKGDFAATNVDWRIISGPGRITATNEWDVTVEPTGTGEDVVVEARFNNDEIQPRFILPVVNPRTIPVKAFIVKPPYRERQNRWKVDKIRLMFDTANEIYSQVGIRFDLVNIEQLSSISNNYWNLEVMHMEQNTSGELYRTFTDKAWHLLNYYSTGDCIEVYFIGKILNSPALALKSDYGIIFSREADGVRLAHELGHCLSLEDCYPKHQFPTNNGYTMIYAQYYYDTVDCLTLIGTRDWGEESGRGFYEISDTYGRILSMLMMYGYDDGTAEDIPDNIAYSLRKGARTSYDTWVVEVGAEQIEENSTEVYSK